MLEIIICEDDFVFRTLMEEIVTNYITIHELPAKLALAESRTEPIIDYIQQQPPGEFLFFLDVDLLPDDPMDGVDLAATIRQEDHLSKIVLVTAHEVNILRAYREFIEASDVIIKEEIETLKERVHRAIDLALDHYHRETPERKIFTYRQGRVVKNIPVDQIYYFEVVGNRKVALVAEGLNTTFTSTLTNLYNEESLEDFLRAHQSYLVNPAAIESVDKSEKLVTMVNGLTYYYTDGGIPELRRGGLL